MRFLLIVHFFLLCDCCLSHVADFVSIKMRVRKKEKLPEVVLGLSQGH